MTAVPYLEARFGGEVHLRLEATNADGNFAGRSTAFFSNPTPRAACTTPRMPFHFYFDRARTTFTLIVMKKSTLLAVFVNLTSYSTGTNAR